MAFKSVEEFNEERYQGKFRLPNDKDTADVIFLYTSKRDELKVDAHYIKSNSYTGYVHCLGKGCPVCAKGYKMLTKIFVPLYNIRQNGVTRDKIEFWERSMRFDHQLDADVFNTYANPSEYVFKITRDGVSGDQDTRYTIQATNRNNVGSYADILAKFNAKMPDYYSTVIREFSAFDLENMIKKANDHSVDLPEYTPIPRAGYQSSMPDTFVDAAEAVGNPVSPDTSDPILDQFDDETDDGDELATPNF